MYEEQQLETCSSSFCSLRLPPPTGAGIFVTTVVAGSVALVKPFVVASRPFLRDVSFYMVAVFWTFLMLFRRTTSLGETLGYLSLYVVYVVIVIVSSFIYQHGDYKIQGEFPLWLLILLLGLFLSAIVFCSTSNDCPPKYHPVFAVLGFMASAVLISAAASEVVSVLHMLGVVLSLSNTVLGLTLLAWGNSIGDCFSDITVAKQGYPQMAISACFGGIIFNMLFGVGLGCLVQMIKTQSDVQFEAEGLLTWILTGALGLSLALSFITIPLSRFHLDRGYGIFLLVFYAAFLLVALLTEFGKIHI
ncbi:hypothetical protein fugu_003785 [Takifugu bimaculatus]|uniref:Sodium/calcium exchanger membrane region domain-containing protein n=1 Tax=Takifugu bimaculatus TaxID=433685 RepID=A0A4Z2BAU7_9TELE|nr:hypothetical protein fugu_003785 [Takifugu bimaculatus]